MTRPISDTVYLLPANGGSHEGWTRVHLGQNGPDWPESWLRDHVAAQPELVLGACEAFGFIDADEGWRLWTTELAIPGVGLVDVAFVSSEGRVALVEVKLAKNPENRRAVVAQLLEYAIHLREASLADLAPLPTLDGAPPVDAEDVQRHLRDGDFLLVVAADAADERAGKLTRAVLDRNAIHPWDLALVDLGLFAPAGPDGDPEGLLCVPHVIGGVRCESRHVVEVKVSNTAQHASVVVQLAEPESVQDAKGKWDRESFGQQFARFAANVSFSSLMLDLVSRTERSVGMSVRYGRGKYPTALLACAGVVFASVDRTGLWIYGPQALMRAFGRTVGETRHREVCALFPEYSDRKQYFLVRADDPRLRTATELLQSWLGA